MQVTIRREWQETFACHEKSCAPPPAGTGGSSPSNSRLKVGSTWHDKEHGAVRVISVEPVSGKRYDKVTVEKNGSVYDGRGTKIDLYLGSTGASKRVTEGESVRDPFVRKAASTRRYPSKPSPSDDSDRAYDAMKDERAERGTWNYGQRGRLRVRGY